MVMAANYHMISNASLSILATYSSAMKVLGYTEHKRLIFRYTFDLVTPLPRNLDRSFYSFGTSVHWQEHIESEQLGRILGKSRKHVIVKSSTAQRQARSLFNHDFYELGMTMALIDGTVG